MPRERAIAQACWPPAPPKQARTWRDVSWPLAWRKIKYSECGGRHTFGQTYLPVIQLHVRLEGAKLLIYAWWSVNTSDFPRYSLPSHVSKIIYILKSHELTGLSLTSCEHASGHMRRPCKGHGMGCLWLLFSACLTVNFNRYYHTHCTRYFLP